MFEDPWKNLNHYQNLILPWAMPHTCEKFHKNLFTTFFRYYANTRTWRKDDCITCSDCSTVQESCAIAKMTAQCALWVPWKFSGLPDYAHSYYSKHFSWAFVPIDPMNVPTKFEVRSFTRSWDNRGYPKKLGSQWICPRSLFSKTFNGLLFG